MSSKRLSTIAKGSPTTASCDNETMKKKKKKTTTEDGDGRLQPLYGLKRSRVEDSAVAAAAAASVIFSDRSSAFKRNDPSVGDDECCSLLALATAAQHPQPQQKQQHHQALPHETSTAEVANKRTSIMNHNQTTGDSAAAAQQPETAEVSSLSHPMWPSLGQHLLLLHHQQQQQPPPRIDPWRNSSQRLWPAHGEQQHLFNMYWTQVAANAAAAASSATNDAVLLQRQQGNLREETLRRFAYQSSTAGNNGPATASIGGISLPSGSAAASVPPPNVMSQVPLSSQSSRPSGIAVARALMETADLSRYFSITTPPPSTAGILPAADHQRRSSLSLSFPCTNQTSTTARIPHLDNQTNNSNDNKSHTPINLDAMTDPICEFPPRHLPALLALPGDRQRLSPRQVFLRHQIEVFEATEDDITTYTRGRNKRIKLGQVGIRCRHCAHVPVADKQKGAVYFPATLLGLYQAGQNMSTTHLQCGLCTHTPDHVKRAFITLMETTGVGLGAGRAYWMQAGKKLGLEDTEDEGIRFVAPTTKSPNSETFESKQDLD